MIDKKIFLIFFFAVFIFSAKEAVASPEIKFHYDKGKVSYRYDRKNIECSIPDASGCTHASIQSGLRFEKYENKEIFHITFSFSFIVELSTRYKKGTCHFDMTLKHEMTHVALFRKTFEKYKNAIAMSLLKAAGDSPVSKATLQKVEKVFQKKMNDLKAEMTRQNALLDGPEHYGYQNRQCYGKQ